jgi:hypothetical protein
MLIISEGIYGEGGSYFDPNIYRDKGPIVSIKETTTMRRGIRESFITESTFKYQYLPKGLIIIAEIDRKNIRPSLKSDFSEGYGMSEIVFISFLPIMKT